MNANGSELVRTVKSRKSSRVGDFGIPWSDFHSDYNFIRPVWKWMPWPCGRRLSSRNDIFVRSPLVRKLFPMKRKQRKGFKLFYFHFIFLHKFTHFQIVGWEPQPQPSKYAIHYDVLQLFQVTSFDNKRNGRMKRNAQKLCSKSSAFTRQQFYAMYDVVGLARPTACIVRVKAYVKSFANSEPFAGMLDGMPIFVFRSLRILWMVCCISVRKDIPWECSACMPMGRGRARQRRKSLHFSISSDDQTS